MLTVDIDDPAAVKGAVEKIIKSEVQYRFSKCGNYIGLSCKTIIFSTLSCECKSCLEIEWLVPRG